MARNRKEQKLTRERMAQTGENYTTALAAIRESKRLPEPAPLYDQEGNFIEPPEQEHVWSRGDRCVLLVEIINIQPVTDGKFKINSVPSTDFFVNPIRRRVLEVKDTAVLCEWDVSVDYKPQKPDWLDVNWIFTSRKLAIEAALQMGLKNHRIDVEQEIAQRHRMTIKRTGEVK